MGLDMYLFAVPKIEGMELREILHANIHLSALRQENDVLFSKIKDYVKSFEEFGFKWESLLTEVMYWRKANHIHYWFVENVQNGIDDNGALSEVSKDQLVKLYNCCNTVLTDNSKAIELLPTMGGPFFGSLVMDSFYYEEIKRTIEELQELLAPFFLDENYLLYQSSW